MAKNIALVLSSGGARGFAHIGVIRELRRYGYNITSVAGTSMGALVGGLYAAGGLDVFEEWVVSLDLMEVLKLTDFSISTKGLVKGNRIIKKMKEIIPERDIETLDIPFCAVATDIINGTEKVFSHGSLYDAIRASISIPTVFQPFRIGNNYYVDGGVLNPIPISQVDRKGNDQLVVVNVNSFEPPTEPAVAKKEPHDPKHLEIIKSITRKLSNTVPKSKNDDIGVFNLTNRSISLMLYQISTLTLKNYNPDIIINVSRYNHGPYDFYKAEEIIRDGEIAADKVLSVL